MSQAKYAVTGHRPDKLGGYSPSAEERRRVFARQILRHYNIPGSNSVVFTGMAQGWDQAIAAACIDLHVNFVAVLPFEGQELHWPPPARLVYRDLINRAAEVITHPGGPAGDQFQIVKMMHARNEFLVNHSNIMIGLHNGDKVGGTAHCMKLAYEKVDLFSRYQVRNAWGMWQMFCKNHPLPGEITET